MDEENTSTSLEAARDCVDRLRQSGAIIPKDIGRLETIIELLAKGPVAEEDLTRKLFMGKDVKQQRKDMSSFRSRIKRKSMGAGIPLQVIPKDGMMHVDLEPSLAAMPAEEDILGMLDHIQCSLLDLGEDQQGLASEMAAKLESLRGAVERLTARQDALDEQGRSNSKRFEEILASTHRLEGSFYAERLPDAIAAVNHMTMLVGNAHEIWHSSTSPKLARKEKDDNAFERFREAIIEASMDRHKTVRYIAGLDDDLRTDRIEKMVGGVRTSIVAFPNDPRVAAPSINYIIFTLPRDEKKAIIFFSTPQPDPPEGCEEPVSGDICFLVGDRGRPLITALELNFDYQVARGTAIKGPGDIVPFRKKCLELRKAVEGVLHRSDEST